MSDIRSSWPRRRGSLVSGLAVAFVLVVASACGGDDDDGEGAEVTVDAALSVADAAVPTIDAMPPSSPDATDPNACTGDTGCNGECELGNDFVVGRYCTPRGGECANTPNRLAPFCTADSSQTDLWFCTRPCADDSQCGTDAECRGAESGGPKGCFPLFCEGQ